MDLAAELFKYRSFEVAIFIEQIGVSLPDLTNRFVPFSTRRTRFRIVSNDAGRIVGQVYLLLGITDYELLR